MSERELWTGSGEHEPPARVEQVRDAAGRIAERQDDKWLYVFIPDDVPGAANGRTWSWQGTGMRIDGPYEEMRIGLKEMHNLRVRNHVLEIAIHDVVNRILDNRKHMELEYGELVQWIEDRLSSVRPRD